MANLTKEDVYYIVIECMWGSKFVKHGDSRITKETLKKSNWNPETHTPQLWRYLGLAPHGEDNKKT